MGIRWAEVQWVIQRRGHGADDGRVTRQMLKTLRERGTGGQTNKTITLLKTETEKLRRRQNAMISEQGFSRS